MHKTQEITKLTSLKVKLIAKDVHHSSNTREVLFNIILSKLYKKLRKVITSFKKIRHKSLENSISCKFPSICTYNLQFIMLILSKAHIKSCFNNRICDNSFKIPFWMALYRFKKV